MPDSVLGQKYSTPPAGDVAVEANAADDVFERVARRPEHIAFARKVDALYSGSSASP